VHDDRPGDDRPGDRQLGVGDTRRHAPAWHPDPVGDHDFRYHNGVRWTADVATNGQRYVAPLVPPAGPVQRRAGGLPLVAGVIALAISWIPFICAIGAVLALVAIVSGARSRRDSTTRGVATAGMITGVSALALAAGGLWFTVVGTRELGAFEKPGRHETVLIECAEVDDGTRASATITNLESTAHSYVVTVEFARGRDQRVEVDDVRPGETREFEADENLRFDDNLDCAITDVNGPYPFGVEIDQ
jgi:hypothetical protein